MSRDEIGTLAAGDPPADIGVFKSMPPAELESRVVKDETRER